MGVVVVGETPYAEGVGDVGNGHDLELSAADRAAVDTVCAAMKCAVLVVSGRPQLVGDRLGAVDALGVLAAGLRGRRRRGRAVRQARLRRSAAGDLAEVGGAGAGQRRRPDYDPQFPYGWGLTTLRRSRGAGSRRWRRSASRPRSRPRAKLGPTPAGRAIVARARLMVQQKAAAG
ncbi:hypothetical protein SCALM49S_03545 [Streptomyces californicus]